MTLKTQDLKRNFEIPDQLFENHNWLFLLSERKSCIATGYKSKYIFLNILCIGIREIESLCTNKFIIRGKIKILLLCIAMCLLSLSRETESISSLCCNLDHCNQCCIHQPKSIHQSDLPIGILIHPSVKPTPKTNNENIVAM